MLTSTIWFYALGSVTAVSAISLVGVFALAVNETRLRRILFFLVALAAGALFGDVFIHILPEIFAGQTTTGAALWILAGLLLFFVLEKFLHWRHSHEVDDCETPEHHRRIHPLGHLNLVADGFHNLLDGIIIGVSYLSAPAVGLATTIAIILHEIPQEIGDFGILLHAGFSRGRALLFNLLSALLAVVGVVAALALGAAVEKFTTGFLALAAGGFLYIAGSDLVPELHKTTEPKKSFAQFSAIILGVVLMLLLTLLE